MPDIAPIYELPSIVSTMALMVVRISGILIYWLAEYSTGKLHSRCFGAKGSRKKGPSLVVTTKDK